MALVQPASLLQVAGDPELRERVGLYMWLRNGCSLSVSCLRLSLEWFRVAPWCLLAVHLRVL